MKRVSLIFTSSADLHTDKLLTFDTPNLNIVRLNLDQPTTWSLEFHNGDVRVKTNEVLVGLEDIFSVFVRRIPNLESYLRSVPDSAKEYKEYIANQSFNLFSDCLAVLDAKTVFVNPLASSARLGKAVQGHLAKEVGFLTPLTYMGADVKTAREFCTEIFDRGDIPCVKPIVNTKVQIHGETHTQFTNTLSRDALSNLESLSVCPTIFQQYIKKSYEVRATVIGDKIFAAKIDSQKAGGGTAIDWRRYNIPITPHSEIKLPNDVCDRIINLHKRIGLIYSAFDFVVTTDGDFVFLETNPYGQWLWIEDLTGLKISKAIVDFLSNSK